MILSDKNACLKNSTMCFTFILIMTSLDYASSVIIRSSKLESFDNCGGEFSGYQYSVTSPDYPSNYSEYQDCIYILRGSHLANCNQVFHLQFSNFSLRLSPNCEQDYLIIDDKNVLCGDVKGVRTFSSKNNTLTLRFHSGKGGAHNGFKILVTTLPCPASTEAAKSTPDNSKHRSDQGYPVYRPEDVFSVSKHYSTVRTNWESKPNSNHNNHNYLNKDDNLFLNELKPPKHVNNVDTNRTSTPTKISTYFFASPDDKKNEKMKTKDATFPGSNNDISNVQNVNDIASRFLINNDNVSVENRNHQNLVIPEKTYGVPAPRPGYNPQIQTGEVFDNTLIDCNPRPNINNVYPENYPRGPIVPGDLYPAVTYGAPGSPYPPSLHNPSGVFPPPRIPPVVPPPSNPLQPVPPPTQLNPFFPGHPGVENNPGFIAPPVVPPINPRPPVQPPNNLIPINIDNTLPLRQCCNSAHTATTFFFSSPGFSNLFYSGNPYECVYTITPGPNVCRIRFNFKYFNYGIDDVYCSSGYMVIDGRRYCGCKTGLSVISNVQNGFPKIIGVKYVGFPRTKISGFLIEVIQETCIYNNYPSNQFRRKKEIESITIDPLDGFGNSSNRSKIVDRIFSIEKARVKRDSGYYYPKPNVDFAAEIIMPGNLNALGFVSPANCEAFNFVSWTHATKQMLLYGGRCNTINNNNNNINTGGWNPIGPDCPPNRNPGYIPPSIRNYPTIGAGPINPGPSPPFFTPGYPGISEYPRTGISPLQGCQYISARDGIITSPFYPNFYPPNSNVCFRFVRAPNVCRLSLCFSDFNLENSPGCVKDYLLFNNQNSKYCGRSIAGRKSLHDFPRTNFIDLQFVSDAFGAGRGFKIVFNQIPCGVI